MTNVIYLNSPIKPIKELPIDVIDVNEEKLAAAFDEARDYLIQLNLEMNALLFQLKQSTPAAGNDAGSAQTPTQKIEYP